MMKKVIIVTMASLFLMACGGGSSSGGGSAAPAVVDKPEPIKTEDLVAPDGFSFNPVTAQSLTINLSGTLAQRTHLSIYSEFSERESGEFIVNYDSKVIDGAVVNGSLFIEFSLAQNQSTIVAEIWSYDGSLPLQRKFEIDNNTLVWE